MAKSQGARTASNSKATEVTVDYSEVASEHPNYIQMADDLALIQTLRQGTKAMRAAGQTYLPRYDKELLPAWENRLHRSTLYNALEETLGFLKGKVFNQPLAMSEDSHELIKTLAENIDGQGNHISIFSQELFDDAMADGVVHLLVDMPPIPTDETGAPVILTKADEQANGGRYPYWAKYQAKDVLGWRSKVVGGKQVLTQVRVLEKLEEDEGDFGVIETAQIRVFEIQDGKAIYRVFQKQEVAGGKEIWVERVDMGGTFTKPDGTAFDFIPWVTFYTNKTDFMTAQPPLLDLAWKNVEHWQVASDHRNCLAAACFAILAISGYKSDDTEITVGPFCVITLKDAQSKAYYVEHTGAALGSARTHLQDVKEEMGMYGLRMLIQRTGATPTATGEAIDESKVSCDLQADAQKMVDALNLALEYTGVWLALEENSVGTIEMDMDFSLSSDRLTFADLCRAAGPPLNIIPREVAWKEMKRRGWVGKDMDIREFEAMLEKQARAAGAVAAVAGSFLKTPVNPPGQVTPPAPTPGVPSPQPK